MLNSLTTSDKVQIVSIISTLIISVVSICIALATLRQTKNSTIEANRANIVFYIARDRDDTLFSLIIKNFGKTSGSLKNIILDPPLSYADSKTSLEIKSITEYKDIYLAPNQSIKTLFDFREYKDTIFNATVTYTCDKKSYTDSYVLNLDYFSSVITASTKSPNSQDELNHINTSLKIISDKMN